MHLSLLADSRLAVFWIALVLVLAIHAYWEKRPQRPRAEVRDPDTAEPPPKKPRPPTLPR